MASESASGNRSDMMLSSPGSSDGSCDEPIPKRQNTTQGQKSGLLRTRRRATGRTGGENSGSSNSSSSSKAAVQAKDKEPHLVQRRNARERRRVSLVNEGFIRLRRKIPTEPRNKKLSKVKTLRTAINYIMHLKETLDEEANRQHRLEELENLGMTIPLQHAPPHQGYTEWTPYPEPAVVCNGFEYGENHGGYYY
ncbi:uncharacterized protein [Amphiura filiformis]|uniref:uncharacterized protein n=1 Tax=Amphiura filiformis TaxID=82378 RepID=UPI003B21F92B